MAKCDKCGKGSTNPLVGIILVVGTWLITGWLVVKLTGLMF